MDRIEPFTNEEGLKIYEVLSSALASNINYVDQELLQYVSLEAMATSLQGIIDPIGQLATWIYDRLKEVSSWFASVVDTLVKNVFNTLIKPMLDAISSGIYGISSLASSIWNTISNIPGMITGVINSIVTSINNLWGSIQSVLSGITSSIQGFISTAINGILGVLSSISGLVSSLATMLSNAVSSIITAITNLPSAIKGFIDALWAGVASALSGIASSLQGFISTAINGILGVLGGITNTLTALGSTLGGAISSLWSNIQSAISSFSSAIMSAVGGVVNTIAGLISSAIQGLWSGIQTIISGVSGAINAIWNGIQSLFSRIYDSLKGFWDWVRSGIEGLSRFVADSTSNLGSMLVKGIQGVVELTRVGFEGVSNAFRSLWQWISDGLSSLASSLTVLVQHIQQLGALVMGGFNQFINFFANIPNILTGIFKSITDFFTWLWNSIQEFVTDPRKFLQEKVIAPLWSGMQWIGGKIFEGLTWLWEQIKGAVGTLLSWLKGAVDTLSDLMSGFVVWITSAFRNLSETLSKSLKSMIDWILSMSKPALDAVRTAFTIISDPLRAVFKDLGISSPPYLTPDRIIMGISVSTLMTALLYSAMYEVMIIPRAISFSIRGLAHNIASMFRRVTISLGFLGTGGTTEFSPGIALGSTLINIADEIDRVSGKWLEYSSQGMLFSYGTVVSRLITFNIRNWIPVEVPSQSDMIEVLRRGVVADKLPEHVGSTFKDLYEGIVYYMAIRGHSDFFISVVTSNEDKFYTTIIDRFMVERKIPLSLRYTLPSPSEVVRWLIRDIVTPVKITAKDFEKNILKLLGMRGYPPDIAKLFFIAHFRYPSPRALAQFWWRAVGKVLWLSDTMEEPEIKSAVGATYDALSPKELNERFQVVKNAINVYWRWHDYAPFTWYPDFTTDKAIMLELTADLPRRIDLRWLMRWGIFEHLMASGMKPDTPMPAIITVMRSATGTELHSTKVTPEISMDVRLLARLLEAQGYHPDFVPSLSVAFSHQVLSDEMTLVRTGFISAFREGVLSLESSESLLSGLFVIKFKTGFIDTTTGAWSEINYNKPLLWLSGERRLLQLRSVFDRHVDLWKDLMRETVNGVRRVAITPQEALEYMKRFFADLSKSWSASVKAITGVDWSPVLDEKYVGLWLEYAEITRTIEARVWIRGYISRVMGWLMYRVSYGWLTKEDYETLINSFVEKNWLTQTEAEFFITAFEWMSGIVAREYIPTPLTLATLSEYMVIDKSMVEKVFSRQRVPEEFRPLYEEYIRVRPLKSDFKSLITSYRKALVKGVISEDQWNVILGEAKEYGFKDVELSIIKRIADIESLIDVSKERIPTPSTLATLAEYMVIDPKLIDKSINAYKLDEDYAGLYRTYIAVRPIKSDYKSLLSTARKALRSAVIDDKTWKTYLDSALRYGFTQTELDIYQAIADLEILIENSKEYVPTPSQLYSFAEYMVIDENTIRNALIARNVREPWVSLWIKLIKTRIIADDVRALMTSYYRAVRYGASISEDLKNTIIRYFTIAGVSEEELKIRDLATQLDTMVESIPTLSQIATMSEYIEVPTDYVNTILSRRRVERTFSELWVRYISTRMISSEVGRVVTAFTTLYVRFAVPQSLIDTVANLMAVGGWTSKERDMWSLELYLRRTYRELTTLIPTLRQFLSDGTYIPSYEVLLEDLFTVFGLDITKYQKQLEYYKKLLKNRRIWRHFSWWRTRLMNAYANDILTLDEAKRKLQKFKDIGLVDDDEIAVILDGLELNKAYVKKVYG